jgi:PAS domain S-box-containing protein
MSVALFSQWFRDKELDGGIPRLWQVNELERSSPPPLATILEASPVPMLAFNHQYLVLAANGRAARLLGYSVGQLADKPLSELLEPQVMVQLRDALEPNAAVDPSGSFRGYGLHQDRHYLPLQLSLQPVHNGQEVCWFASLIDFSAEQRQSEALASHQQRINRILEALPMGASLVSHPDTTIHNQAARTLWGLGKDPAAARQWRGQLFQPGNEQALREQERPEWQAQRSGITVENVPIEIGTADGKRRNVLYSAIPLDPASGEVLVVMSETTELHILRKTLEQTQEMFDAFFQSPAGGVALVLPNGCLYAANAPFCKMLGYGDEELQGYSAIDLTHPEDRAREALQLARLTRGEIDGFQIEKRYLCRDNTICWGMLSVSLLREPDGQERYALHIVQPINVLKAHEALLEQHEQELTMLTNHNPDAIGRFDQNLRCTYANPAFTDLVPSSIQAVGTLLDDLGFPMQVSTIWEMVLQLVLQDGQTRSFEFSLPHGYLQETFLVKVVPEPENSEHERTVLTIARDISELKEKEEQLRRHQEDLQASRATIRAGAAYHEKEREEER